LSILQVLSIPRISPLLRIKHCLHAINNAKGNHDLKMREQYQTPIYFLNKDEQTKKLNMFLSCGDLHTSVGIRQRRALDRRNKQRKDSRISLSPSRLWNKTEL
jgi:hypothetical protein